MSIKLYDLEPLNALVDGNPKFKTYLIELFNETTPPILTDMRNSCEASDWKSLYAHSHKIKPTVESMGIFSMKSLINDIMLNAKDKKETEKMRNMVSEFCATIEEVIEQLKTNEL